MIEAGGIGEDALQHTEDSPRIEQRAPDLEHSTPIPAAEQGVTLQTPEKFRVRGPALEIMAGRHGRHQGRKRQQGVDYTSIDNSRWVDSPEGRQKRQVDLFAARRDPSTLVISQHARELYGIGLVPDSAVFIGQLANGTEPIAVLDRASFLAELDKISNPAQLAEVLQILAIEARQYGTIDTNLKLLAQTSATGADPNPTAYANYLRQAINHINGATQMKRVLDVLPPDIISRIQRETVRAYNSRNTRLQIARRRAIALGVPENMGANQPDEHPYTDEQIPVIQALTASTLQVESLLVQPELAEQRLAELRKVIDEALCLAGLSRAAKADQIRQFLKGSPDDGLLDAIYQANPGWVQGEVEPVQDDLEQLEAQIVAVNEEYRQVEEQIDALQQANRERATRHRTAGTKPDEAETAQMAEELERLSNLFEERERVSHKRRALKIRLQVLAPVPTTKETPVTSEPPLSAEGQEQPKTPGEVLLAQMMDGVEVPTVDDLATVDLGTEYVSLNPGHLSPILEALASLPASEITTQFRLYRMEGATAGYDIAAVVPVDALVSVIRENPQNQELFNAVLYNVYMEMANTNMSAALQMAKSPSFRKMGVEGARRAAHMAQNTVSFLEAILRINAGIPKQIGQVEFRPRPSDEAQYVSIDEAIYRSFERTMAVEEFNDPERHERIQHLLDTPIETLLQEP